MVQENGGVFRIPQIAIVLRTCVILKSLRNSLVHGTENDLNLITVLCELKFAPKTELNR